MKQSYKLGIMLSVSAALIITVLASIKLAHGTTETNLNQASSQQPVQNAPSVESQAAPFTNLTNTTFLTPKKPTTVAQVPGQTPSTNESPSSTTSDNNPIIPNHTPNVGILSGHIYYNANGNACGIGPTGTCLLPVSKSFEVRDSSNSLIQIVTSNSDGAFKTALAPGTYTIIPEAGSGVNPSANQQTVTISKTQYATIAITYWPIAVTNSPILN